MLDCASDDQQVATNRRYKAGGKCMVHSFGTSSARALHEASSLLDKCVFVF